MEKTRSIEMHGHDTVDTHTHTTLFIHLDNKAIH